MSLLPRIFQTNNDESGKQRLTIAFSTPLLLACALVLICAIAWAFFMGFMVGKGQNPEVKINDMTGGLLSAREEEKLSPPLLEQPEEEIPEQQPVVTESAPDTPQKTTAHPFVRPDGAGLGAWGNAPKEKSPPQGNDQTQRTKIRKNQPTEVFDYTFQAAAFKNQKEADNLRKKLAAAGMRCQTRKSGKVSLVIVSIRGGEQEADNLRKKIQAQKLGRPILLSKKPVAQKQPAKTKGKAK